MRELTRRSFLEKSLAAGVVGGLARRLGGSQGQAAEPPSMQPVRLGGPIIPGTDDPEALARRHRALGYGAAYCPNVALTDGDRIRAVAKAFQRHDVVIAEVGRWVNLLDNDPEKRAAHLQRVTDGLALAEAVGARCCVDIAGSFSQSEWYGPHPDNLSETFFDAAVENARKIIDAVQPRRAMFCYEMMGWALPDSPESYLRMKQAVDRKQVGVHLDPCNLINSPSRFYRNTALLNACFDTLGAWIASCHAKDLTWDVEMNIHFREVCPGKGALDYATYLRRLARLPQQPPLMMEHLSTAEEYDAGRRHLFAVGQAAGVQFA